MKVRIPIGWPQKRRRRMQVPTGEVADFPLKYVLATFVYYYNVQGSELVSGYWYYVLKSY